MAEAEEEKLDESKEMSFWDHLEDLRHGLFRHQAGFRAGDR